MLMLCKLLITNRAQVVGWPPIRSFRKNTLATKKEEVGGFYVKVSMDGAPYLRKIDLNTLCTYAHLSSALQKMFTCFTIGIFSIPFISPNHLDYIDLDFPVYRTIWAGTSRKRPSHRDPLDGSPPWL